MTPTNGWTVWTALVKRRYFIFNFLDINNPFSLGSKRNNEIEFEGDNKFQLVHYRQTLANFESGYKKSSYKGEGGAWPCGHLIASITD